MKIFAKATIISYCVFLFPVGALPGLHSVPTTNLVAEIGSYSGPAKTAQVTVTITNEGQNEYKILRSPSSLFDKSPFADRFHPTSKNDSNQAVPFWGDRVKWSPEEAIWNKDYVIVGGNESLTFDFRVGSYWFSPGTYTLSPSPFIMVLDTENNAQLMRYKFPPSGEITITALQEMSTGHDQSIIQATNTKAKITGPGKIYKCDNACSLGTRSCASQILDAAVTAQHLATDAWEHLDHHLDSWSPRLAKWYGAFDEQRAKELWVLWKQMSVEPFAYFNYICDCTDPNLYGFIHADDFPNIHLCPQFWTPRQPGLNSQAGTIIHLVSQFNAFGMKTDVAHGVEQCKDLAEDAPQWAFKNSDSSEYYAENLI